MWNACTCLNCTRRSAHTCVPQSTRRDVAGVWLVTIWRDVSKASQDSWLKAASCGLCACHTHKHSFELLVTTSNKFADQSPPNGEQRIPHSGMRLLWLQQILPSTVWQSCPRTHFLTYACLMGIKRRWDPKWKPLNLFKRSWTLWANATVNSKADTAVHQQLSRPENSCHAFLPEGKSSRFNM